MLQNNPDNCNVAAVIGSTVKIYGHSNNGFRPFMSEQNFTNHGKAKEFAEEYDTKQRVTKR